ncbi:3-isopropylmalate dehydratase small subunit [Caballeronia sordidicola]|uniref:3-isopropylmalate dehydratase small subunit n=1 Tax=Caballeronia sordidicola TaxID=196367 RepID=A0A242MZX2_CABSO|nr:3-isopropylmalate dehydratase small subunit [Caballeronia sordidicola]
MARAGLLHVSRDERRLFASGRTLCIDDQSQFRRPARTRRPHASDEPRDGRRRRTDRQDHRCPHAGEVPCLS